MYSATVIEVSKMSSMSQLFYAEGALVAIMTFSEWEKFAWFWMPIVTSLAFVATILQVVEADRSVCLS